MIITPFATLPVVTGETNPVQLTTSVLLYDCNIPEKLRESIILTVVRVYVHNADIIFQFTTLSKTHLVSIAFQCINAPIIFR